MTFILRSQHETMGNLQERDGGPFISKNMWESVQVPKRATYIKAVLLELSRISSIEIVQYLEFDYYYLIKIFYEYFYIHFYI